MSQNVLEDAEKYILAGHGSLLKGDYTIVPENVYIQYTIPRGNKFRNAHTHSIVKKKKIKEVRLKQIYEPLLTDFS